MALDVYFREDIANTIHSVNQAGGNTAALVHRIIEERERSGAQTDMREVQVKLRLYEEGYRDALGAVAVAFGSVEEAFDGFVVMPIAKLADGFGLYVVVVIVEGL